MHLRTEIRFSRLAREFDIYHEAGFFPMKAASRMSTLFTVHDMSLFRFPEHHPKERVRFARMFWEKRCLMVDRFLTVSRFTKEELQGHLPLGSQKITVTPLAHDPDLFYPRSMDHVQASMKSRELPARYFLTVGSGDPRKNMALIPKALQAAELQVPLVAAGWSGWSKETLPDKVIPLGYVSDPELALLYSGALALVFPSSYEGFGLPVLEAMACGCPVVTTRQASLPEVAGEAAEYVQDPSDPLELGGVLKELAEDDVKRRELRDRGLARAAGFSWKRTAELTLGAMLEEIPQMGTEEAAPKGT
jgi:alpha-1,3-rhamnosyl/mannosyltransferase